MNSPSVTEKILDLDPQETHVCLFLDLRSAVRPRGGASAARTLSARSNPARRRSRAQGRSMRGGVTNCYKNARLQPFDSAAGQPEDAARIAVTTSRWE